MHQMHIHTYIFIHTEDLLNKWNEFEGAFKSLTDWIMDEAQHFSDYCTNKKEYGVVEHMEACDVRREGGRKGRGEGGEGRGEGGEGRGGEGEERGGRGEMRRGEAMCREVDLGGERSVHVQHS